MATPTQEALQAAQKWVSRAELETLKGKYRELGQMCRTAPLVRLIAALDRIYAATTEAAQKWVSRDDLDRLKTKYRELGQMCRTAPIVRLIAALDRAYAGVAAGS